MGSLDAGHPIDGSRRRDSLLSLVIPVYDEDENLALLHGEIHAALDPTGRDYEILYVDDASSDQSPVVLAGLQRADPRVRVVRMQRNSGQSAAFDAGFRLARGGIVVTLDSDLQNDPADIPRLLAELADADVVCGVRTSRRDDWVRRATSRIANSVRNRLTAEHITDVGCSLRAMRAEYLEALPMFHGMHRFLPTLLRLQGATRIKEIAVYHRPRLHGVAKYGIGNRLWRALADLFAVRWMRKRWIDRRLAVELPTTETPRHDS